jgi:hypothetical protein
MLIEKGSVHVTIPPGTNTPLHVVLFSRCDVLAASEYRDFSDSELCVSLGVAIPPMDPNESFKMEAQSMKFYREAPSDSEFT